MVTPGKQESSGQATLRNFLELEETPEAPDNQGMLTYIKKLAIYVLDIVDTFLDFTWDEEASTKVLVEGIDRICIKMKFSMEGWTRMRTWIGNMVQSREPS